MNRPENPPAFPRPGYYPDTQDLTGDAFREAYAYRTEAQAGLSLRDYFASHALTGLLAGKVFQTYEPNLPFNGPKVLDPAELATDAYAIADAMLAFRDPSHV